MSMSALSTSTTAISMQTVKTLKDLGNAFVNKDIMEMEHFVKVYHNQQLTPLNGLHFPKITIKVSIFLFKSEKMYNIFQLFHCWL